ncbi:MAG: hypothetical protein NZ932_03200 [Candidatus Bathyarchaeota archaeon]|nr:hypothetical protein [Candidatus Bathyarchaeota archaeon]
MAKTDNDKKEDSEAAKTEEEKRKAEEKREKEKEEIERLKFNVEKLSEELNTAVAELKRSIIDIRSAVSEIENPFNLLRVITSEKDLKKLNHERLPPGVKSLVLGKPEEKVEEKEGAVPPPAALQIPETETLKVEEAREAEEGLKAEEKAGVEEYRQKVKRFPHGTAYLDWVWSLLDVGFTPEDIRQLSLSYEHLGFLPEGCSQQIYSLAVAAEKAKSKGLTKGKLLLIMYKASVISGIGISIEDLRRLITIAERRVIGKTAKRVE